MELSKEELAKLLKEAEAAHAEHEKELGKRDDAWPTWYANYIVNKLNE
tara:strand:- start:12971 stop:13114 length:144 start_codon:yes stop_codon:yes gene_type:complete